MRSVKGGPLPPQTHLTLESCSGVSGTGEEGFSYQLRNSSLSWKLNSSSATETPLSESAGQASPTNLSPRVQFREVTFSTTKATDSPLEYARMNEQPHPFGARALLWQRSRNNQNVKGKRNTNLMTLAVNSLLPAGITSGHTSTRREGTRLV